MRCPPIPINVYSGTPQPGTSAQLHGPQPGRLLGYRSPPEVEARRVVRVRCVGEAVMGGPLAGALVER